MLGSIRSGLDNAKNLEVGQTDLELGAYFQHLSGLSRAGAHLEVSSHFAPGWQGFARASLGYAAYQGQTKVEALGLIGIHGTF